MKDRSNLVPKVITNKAGHQQTVYVKAAKGVPSPAHLGAVTPAGPERRTKIGHQQAHLTPRMAANRLMVKTGDAFTSQGMVDHAADEAYAGFILAHTLRQEVRDNNGDLTLLEGFTAYATESTPRGEAFAKHMLSSDQGPYNPYLYALLNTKSYENFSHEQLGTVYVSELTSLDRSVEVFESCYPGLKGDLVTNKLASGQVREGWNLKEENFPLVPHLRRSVAWMKSLTPEEHDAVAAWTSGAPAIGGALLGDKRAAEMVNMDKDEELTEEDLESYMRVMDGALDKALQADGEARVVWRGLNQDLLSHLTGTYAAHLRGGQSRALAESLYCPGDIMTFGTFASCTDDPGKGCNFASTSHIIFEIETTKSGAVSAVSSWYGGERECLVPRDARYEVTAIDEQVFSRVSSNGSRYEENLVVIHLRDAE